jgi:drug/metabolite transporter (DMT)-like permease
MLNELYKIISEALLSLYPIFIKKIPINLDIQLLTRLLGYSIIPIFFFSFKFIKNNFMKKNILLLSLITLFHIYFSYKGFKMLDTGISYALFYTYPLMIIFWENKKFSPLFLITILGVLLLSVDFKDITSGEGFNMEKMKGIGFILMAAITEVMIFYTIKGKIETNNNWNTLFLSYFPALIVFSLYLLYKKMTNKTIETDRKEIEKFDVKNKSKNWIFIALFFNIVIGTVGYILRFRSVKLLSPFINGILSYVGIITSYIYGIIFDNEKVVLKDIGGIGLIILSNVLMLNKTI